MSTAAILIHDAVQSVNMNAAESSETSSAFDAIHCVTSQKIKLSTRTAVRTGDPAQLEQTVKK
jgi:hypothetical protein